MWWFIIHLLFLLYRGTSQTSRTSTQNERTQDMITNFMRDTLREINAVYNKTDPIRQRSYYTPAFEIGFVLKNMEECYRRMVDIYNSTLTTDLNNWDAKPSDHIMFLKHVEILFWVIDHLSNMLHEIEKKYKVKVAGMFEEQRVWTIPPPKWSEVTRFVSQAVVRMTTTTKRPRQSWWPLDYGWEMDYRW